MTAQSVTIDLHRLPHGEALPLPDLATAGAAGADLYAALPHDTPLSLAPGERMAIPCGFAMALPAGWEAQIRPRSGLALKYGVTVLNAPGTVDADFRGEVQVLLINHGDTPHKIERGARIAQMVIAPVSPVVWNTVSRLDATARGAGGFGSTGGH